MNEDSRDQINPFQENLHSSNMLRGHLMNEFDKTKAKPDFSVLESQIKLPPLIKLKPQINPIKKAIIQNGENVPISAALKKNVHEQRDLLLNQFEMFTTPQDFQFYFPQSKFPPPPPSDSMRISFERQPVVEHENTFRDNLSPEQIADIRENGEFAVKSSRENVKIPYIWKMNETLFKGIKNVQRDWNLRMCAIVGLYEDTYEMLTDSLPEQLIHVGKLPWRIFTLLFGKKQTVVSHTVDFPKEIAKDFWNEIMTKHYVVCREWSSDLWTYLDTQFMASVYEEVPFDGDKEKYKQLTKEKEEQLLAYNLRKQNSTSKINKLNSISNKFDDNWDNISKKVFTEISNSVQQKTEQKSMNPKNDQDESDRKNAEELQILEKFQDQKFTYYVDFFKKEATANSIPANVIEAILTILTLMHLTTKKKRNWDRNFGIQRQRVEKEIRNDNPIRSLNFQWFQRTLKQKFQPIEERLNNEFYNGFIDQEIQAKLNPKQIQACKVWVDFIKTYDARMKLKQDQLQHLQEPSQHFPLSQMCLPPYDVIRNKAGPESNHGDTFTMIKQREFVVTTFSCGWKFKLYCMRLKVWTVNAFVTLIYICLKSPFGLRCLCGIDDFTYDQSINYMTGQITDAKRKTVLGDFLKVLEGITESRNQFEAQPDTGIFGKNCSRICNYLECYVFRFFVVGVLIILTLYPIAIILVSILAFMAVITVWAWMPIVTTFTYLFSIFIYNIDTVDYKHCIEKIFPLFALFFRWIFSVLKIIFYFTAFFIFMPLGSLFIISYSCICRCIRSFTDCIVLCFLSGCGRVPSTDSMFAQKISGPGMASQFYMSIHEEDLYYLVQAEMEQIHIEYIERITKQKLQAPIQKYQKVMRYIVNPLIMYQRSAYGSSSDSYLFGNLSEHPIEQSITQLENQLNDKINKNRRRYPKYPYNVKFTEDEINQYFENTQAIVKAYVEKNKMNKWIFSVNDVHENDYNELTRKIWIKIFNSGQRIFEPIESLEERIRFEDEYGKSYGVLRADVGKVVNAIKGEAKLNSKKVAVVAPLNTALYNRTYNIVTVNQVIEKMRSNYDQSVFFSKENPNVVFTPHLGIKQLIKHSDAQYARLRAENTKRMQEW